MTTVAVVRPGWTDFDEQQRILGSLDLPLNARGEAQLPSLIERLQESLAPEVVLVGTAHPAKGTAAAIGAALGAKVRSTAELNNVNQGLWQGSAIEEIRRKTPRVFKQWEDAAETICPPEGEPWEAAVERVKKALKRPLRKYGSFVIVASEPLATLVSSVLTGEPPDLSAAFPEEPRDPIIEVLEASGCESSFVRTSEDIGKRSAEGLTPFPPTRSRRPVISDSDTPAES